MKIKDIMIPIEKYATVGIEANLYECFAVLKKNGAHRDVLVVDGGGALLGKVTMLDIFLALEPGYKNILGAKDSKVLTASYMANIYKEYNLWSRSLEDLCSKGARLKAGDVMHTPEGNEFVDAEEDLDVALHHYVMGVHQPLLVRDGDAVVGVVRFGDVYETIREMILACEI